MTHFARLIRGRIENAIDERGNIHTLFRIEFFSSEIPLSSQLVGDFGISPKWIASLHTMCGKMIEDNPEIFKGVSPYPIGQIYDKRDQQSL